jgi:hypothetical protein
MEPMLAPRCTGAALGQRDVDEVWPSATRREARLNMRSPKRCSRRVTGRGTVVTETPGDRSAPVDRHRSSEHGPKTRRQGRRRHRRDQRHRPRHRQALRRRRRPRLRHRPPPAELDAAVAAIGPDATGIRADSADLDGLDDLYERVEAEAGRIDVLFANAGGGSLLPLGAITEEQYEDTFGRNVKGVLFTVQKALPLLADGASVILTGSTAASGGTPASASTPRRRPPCAPSRATGSST